jgi:hypothetical protein
MRIVCAGRTSQEPAFADVRQVDWPGSSSWRAAARPVRGADARQDEILVRAHHGLTPGDHMWFWIGGGITLVFVVLTLLRKRSDGGDMGTVSDDWLARHRASRRVEP